MAKKSEPSAPPPEPYYSLPRWLEDWEWYYGRDGKAKPAPSADEFHAHFAEKYPDHTAYFQVRFQAALDYIRAHIDTLTGGEYKEMLTGLNLMGGMYRLYSQCPDEHLGDPYEIELVYILAKEAKRSH